MQPRKGQCQKKITQQVYVCIERECINDSVKKLCAVYKVSRNGSYKWLKLKNIVNHYEKQQTELDYILRIYIHIIHHKNIER